MNARKEVQSFRSVIELTITSIMGTTFKIRMMPNETVLDIKKRIYGREGIIIYNRSVSERPIAI